MCSSSTSSTPELIFVADSDSSDNEEGERRGPGILRNNLALQPQQQQGQEIVQPNSSTFTNTPGVLQELFGIVQWVNTGVKRDANFEETFMEKKVAEMEQRLVENEGKLKQARLKIKRLKQSKTGLQKELREVRNEKLELSKKWVQMKGTFETLQAKYFEDDPWSSAAGQNQPSMLVQLKEEMEDVSEPLAGPSSQLSAAPVNNAIPIPADLCETSFSRADDTCSQNVSASHSTTSPGAMQLGQESGIQLQSPAASTSNTALLNLNPKPHGFDNSKEHLGFYCICGRHFSSKRTMDSHIIYFTCPKQFACTICERRFVGSNYLKGHMLRTHKIVYTGGSNGCRDCGKTFSTLLQLRRHKKLAHYSTTQVNVGAINKKPKTSSVQNRRSIRMQRRHQEGESHSVLTMLQGDCDNCNFCRDKHEPKIRQAVNTNSTNVTASEVTLPSLPSTVTVTAIRSSGTRTCFRSSSVSSSDSLSCSYCNKWFGDDTSGLSKHQQQACPKK